MDTNPFDYWGLYQPWGYFDSFGTLYNNQPLDGYQNLYTSYWNINVGSTYNFQDYPSVNNYLFNQNNFYDYQHLNGYLDTFSFYGYSNFDLTSQFSGYYSMNNYFNYFNLYYTFP